MHSPIRTAALAATVLVSALTLTACQDAGATASRPPADATTPAATAPTAPTAPTDTAPRSSDSSNSSNSSNSSDSSGGSGGSGQGEQTGAADGDKSGYGQVCGSNDLVFDAPVEPRANYILINVKARPGITCSLEGLPSVAFGSDGTAASGAEQAVGEPVVLSGSKKAYAGVNPKTTKDNGGKELRSLIVSVSNDDPDPVSLDVGPFTVDDPIVTNWHTDSGNAIPGDGTDN
ncbi:MULTISPECIES: DUF4232 domain-containing protein [Streptomyces]|uniref:DUF4232 domain-containing protein n=1 Tax=Streptomyces ramulosus TaxID=47762 RepID=A0ABW1FR46_9ACTN